MFLFLPLIPDLALIRDRSTGLRRRIYSALVLGWRGTTKQWHRLEAAMQIMAIAIIAGRRLGPHHRLLRLLDGAGADVALDDLRTLFRRRRDLQWHCRAHHRDGRAQKVPAPRGVSPSDALPESGQAPPADEPAVGVFRLRRTTDGLVRQRAVGDGGLLGDAARTYAPLFWTMVSCNFLIPLPILAMRKLRTITGTVIASMRVSGGNVARAIPDHRAIAGAQVAAIQLGHLRAATRRNHHHDVDVCRDGPALHAVREIRPHHLHMGIEGRRSSQAGSLAPRS